MANQFLIQALIKKANGLEDVIEVFGDDYSSLFSQLAKLAYIFYKYDVPPYCLVEGEDPEEAEENIIETSPEDEKILNSLMKKCIEKRFFYDIQTAVTEMLRSNRKVYDLINKNRFGESIKLIFTEL